MKIKISGQALVPYYRQLLPVFNLFKQKNCELIFVTTRAQDTSWASPKNTKRGYFQICQNMNQSLCIFLNLL